MIHHQDRDRVHQSLTHSLVAPNTKQDIRLLQLRAIESIVNWVLSLCRGFFDSLGRLNVYSMLVITLFGT